MEALDVVKYIDELELASKPKPDLYHKGEQGFVNGGSLVSFTSELPPAKRSDVMNTTLLAQLHADTVCDKRKDTTRWFESYATVLERVGWNVSHFQFEEYNSSGESVKVSNAILEIAKAILSKDQLETCSAAND